jgi:hypothetical protein
MCWVMLNLKTLILIARLCGVQEPACCCDSLYQAASQGHYDCFAALRPPRPGSEFTRRPEVWLYLLLALRHGNLGFVKRVFVDYAGVAEWYASVCVRRDDPEGLQLLLDAAPHIDLGFEARRAAMVSAPRCLRLLLENGVTWNPRSMLCPGRHNRLDVLEVVLQHSSAGKGPPEWYPRVPSVAGCLGHVRFLIRIFKAGCPLWTHCLDGEPFELLSTQTYPMFYPVEQNHPARLGDWSLVVSSDLLVSGPVLLYAAQKGVRLTPRMEGMLEEVRRRALALAGCFHRASRLRRGAGRRARKFDAMGLVPIEIITRIATLAKLSIVELDLVK